VTQDENNYHSKAVRANAIALHFEETLDTTTMISFSGFVRSGTCKSAPFA